MPNRLRNRANRSSRRPTTPAPTIKQRHDQHEGTLGGDFDAPAPITAPVPPPPPRRWWERDDDE